ncbi:branched-chain amino acid ABC transporter permease [Niallia sp. Krafla_26]|uniref:branched-chain amino acid ABC transporter permease n=1 Tax=Niallia sp. Krafla_26 TaxID=3064703 RepID=UPI003D164400
MKKTIIASLLLMIAVMVLPFFISSFTMYMLTEVLIMGIFAMSLGLIMGYGGLQSLGHSAFFGIGAYAVAVLSEKETSIYILLPAAILISCLFAFLTGLIALRNKGIFFLMITLAVTQMLFLLFRQTDLWGGADGLGVSIKPDLGFIQLISPLSLFYFIGIIFVVTYLFLRLYVNSPLGKGLKGVMENESRMVALGYHVKKYQMIVYVIAGGLAGLAGGLYVYKTQFVSPEIYSVHMATTVMIMCFIGGLGTLFGPVIGAGVFIFLQNYVSTMTDRWSLIMGILFVVIVLINKGGIFHLLQTIWNKIIPKKKLTTKQKGAGVIELNESGEAK